MRMQEHCSVFAPHMYDATGGYAAHVLVQTSRAVTHTHTPLRMVSATHTHTQTQACEWYALSMQTPT